MGAGCGARRDGGHTMKDSLARSRALWNRSALVLDSNEVLAQLLDRGSMSDWRELYRLAKADPRLRSRIRQIILTVPVPLPHFWLAALVAAGEPVDWDARLPDYFESSQI